MNRHIVDIARSVISCGVAQIYRIGDEIDEAVYFIAHRFYNSAAPEPAGVCVFSNIADKPTNGHRLVDFIKGHKLGLVCRSEPTLNPRTGNPICVWVWNVDHERLKKYYIDRKIKRMQKAGELSAV